MKQCYLIALLLLTACSQSTQDGRVDVQAFAEALSTADNPQIVDVRTPEEFELGHLEKAININIRGEHFDEQLAALDKNRPTFVHCAKGAEEARSTMAREARKELGFNTVYEMVGGSNGWKAAGNPVIEPLE